MLADAVSGVGSWDKIGHCTRRHKPSLIGHLTSVDVKQNYSIRRHNQHVPVIRVPE